MQGAGWVLCAPGRSEFMRQHLHHADIKLPGEMAEQIGVRLGGTGGMDPGVQRIHGEGQFPMQRREAARRQSARPSGGG